MVRFQDERRWERERERVREEVRRAGKERGGGERGEREREKGWKGAKGAKGDGASGEVRRRRVVGEDARGKTERAGERAREREKK